MTRFRLPVVALTAAAAAVVVMPAGVGSASPAAHPTTIAAAQARVAALNDRAEQLTEAYNTATGVLSTLQRKERITNRQLSHDRAQLTKVTKVLSAGAAAAYKSGGLDPTISLVTSGTAQTFLDQTSSLTEVARYEATAVSTASAAQRDVAAAEKIHSAQVAQEHKIVSSLASQKSQINSLLNQAQAVLSHLKAAQRARIAAQQQATVQHAVAQRTSYHPPAYTGAAAGQAAVAVKFAYAQLGKPYVWGGAGPNSFDCSGLTMRAWGAAGVSLPHSAAGQQGMLHSVSLSAMQPGDLVFYGSPAYHVAIYIGGGRQIAAPHTGTVVQIQSVSGATSAGRP
ncbi:MAG: C40 family peptidase [Frankiaceae bacterium]|nr:C40 family peptidase [Frankiaceae bacterium]MBV9871086.1 C40 family peptidase [Frankiaceae bacterium]